MATEDQAWRDWAKSQYGVITRRQAMDAGLSAQAIQRRLTTQEFRPVHRGVYAVGGAPSSWRQAVVAATLSCPGGVAGFRTAAALYGLSGCRAREVDILVTTPIRRRPAGVIIHRTDSLADVDVGVVEGIPATSPARTLLDLGAVVDCSAVRYALEDALRKNLVSLTQLLEQLSRNGKRGRPGTRALREILASYEQWRGPHESPLEEEMMRVIGEAGLPFPKPQFEVWDGGVLIARLDAAYPERRIGLEADGYEWHSSPPDWLRDRRRQNALGSRGWTIMRFCVEDVTRPAQFVADLRRVYDQKSRSQPRFASQTDENAV